MAAHKNQIKLYTVSEHIFDYIYMGSIFIKIYIYIAGTHVLLFISAIGRSKWHREKKNCYSHK